MDLERVPLGIRNIADSKWLPGEHLEPLQAFFHWLLRQQRGRLFDPSSGELRRFRRRGRKSSVCRCDSSRFPPVHARAHF